MTGSEPHRIPLDALHAEARRAETRLTELRRRLAGEAESAAPIPAADAELLFTELDLALEELHTAEEELRQQNDELLEAHRRLELERLRFVELFEQAPVAYVVTDSNGQIRAANRAASALLGVSVRHLTGKPLLVFVPSDDRGDFMALLRRLRAEPRVDGWPGQIVPRHGAPLPIEITAVAYRTIDGELEGIRWVLHDTSAQARMRAEHFRMADLFGALLEATSLPVVALDRDNVVTTWNAAAERTFGWTRSEVLGRPVPFLPPDGEPDAACDIGDLPIPTLERFGRGRLVCRTREGGTVSLGVTTARLREADGEERGRLAVLTPDGGAPLPARRSSETSEVVRLLAGGVAHNFNNLLTVMLAYTDLAAAELHPDSGAALEDLRLVRRAVTRASEIANELLGYAERLELAPRPVSVNTVAERAAAAIAPSLPAEVRLVVRLEPDAGEARCDPMLLERMLGHLLRNAAEAVSGSGTIALETRAVALAETDLRPGSGVAEAGPYTLIRVRDTGPGMTADTRARIFDPFYTTKPPGRGVGLGLAMVRGVVGQCGGLIRADSGPGRGTTFDVYLPRITA
jgi:PAS domain S-box-containing protein